jgi:hypothetical protein
MKKLCEQRYGLPVGKNRISWDKDGSLFWMETNGKIRLLSFANERIISNYGAGGDVSVIGARKRMGT